MIKKNVKVQNKYGLHARPCSLITKTAQKFRADLFIKKDDIEANGKSIMGVMQLAAELDSELILIANGIDEEYLLEEIIELFNNKFNED